MTSFEAVLRLKQAVIDSCSQYLFESNFSDVSRFYLKLLTKKWSNYIVLFVGFQYTDKHGEVCPVNWKPGKKAIVIDSNKMEKVKDANCDFWGRRMRIISLSSHPQAIASNTLIQCQNFIAKIFQKIFRLLIIEDFKYLSL